MSKLIFDVGFNIGQDTAFYLAQGHTVVAVEADPVLAEKGARRFSREVQSGRLTIVNVGIAAQEGHADFWVCEEKPEFNSFFREIAARDGYRHHKITVPTARFGTVLDKYGTPHYLKIDIEGHDLLCVEDLKSGDLPAYISLESECPVDENSDGVEDGLVGLHRLRAAGYTRFKLIDQRSFNSLSVPASLNQTLQKVAERYILKPPLRDVPGAWRLAASMMSRTRLERKLGWQFPMGSSGVWGPDTPGRWLSFEQAERGYKHYRDRYFESGGAVYHSFWCDWHATV